jgi:hypothetical protein
LLVPKFQLGRQLSKFSDDEGDIINPGIVTVSLLVVLTLLKVVTTSNEGYINCMQLHNMP